MKSENYKIYFNNNIFADFILYFIGLLIYLRFLLVSESITFIHYAPVVYLFLVTLNRLFQYIVNIQNRVLVTRTKNNNPEFQFFDFIVEIAFVFFIIHYFTHYPEIKNSIHWYFWFLPFFVMFFFINLYNSLNLVTMFKNIIRKKSIVNLPFFKESFSKNAIYLLRSDKTVHSIFDNGFIIFNYNLLEMERKPICHFNEHVYELKELAIYMISIDKNFGNITKEDLEIFEMQKI